MNIITESNIADWTAYLMREERAQSTIEKYTRDIRAFGRQINGGGVTKDAAVEYKRQLSETHKATSINASIAALNSYFSFMKWDIKLKSLKIQKQTFTPEEKELTRAEYERLIAAAKSKGGLRMNLILQTICSTGIRVSELSCITVKTARTGQAEITNKGKTRTVFLPKKLQAALLRYANERGINDGCIFITRTGKAIDRREVWAGMKALCKAANVPEEKVYPHNLRHLFAREFYSRHNDIVRLADILGHSSVNTTRIYTMESGAEHRRLIDGLGFAFG